MEIVKIDESIYGITDKTPYIGQFVLDTVSQQMVYVDLSGLVWGLSVSDYDLYVKWYEEQNANRKKMKELELENAELRVMASRPTPEPPARYLPDSGAADTSAGIVLNNCTNITINGGKNV